MLPFLVAMGGAYITFYALDRFVTPHLDNALDNMGAPGGNHGENNTIRPLLQEMRSIENRLITHTDQIMSGISETLLYCTEEAILRPLINNICSGWSNILVQERAYGINHQAFTSALDVGYASATNGIITIFNNCQQLLAHAPAIEQSVRLLLNTWRSALSIEMLYYERQVQFDPSIALSDTELQIKIKYRGYLEKLKTTLKALCIDKIQNGRMRAATESMEQALKIQKLILDIFTPYLFMKQDFAKDFTIPVEVIPLIPWPPKGYIRQVIPGDGDCGYTAFGVTRENAVQSLLDHINDIANIIKPLVTEALLLADFYQYLPIDIQPVDIVSNSQALLEHYSNDVAVQIAYINYDVRDRHIDNGWADYRILQALAHIQNVSLYIWELGENNFLVPHVPTSTHLGDRIHLLFANNNHFDRLELVGFGDNVETQSIPPISYNWFLHKKYKIISFIVDKAGKNGNSYSGSKMPNLINFAHTLPLFDQKIAVYSYIYDIMEHSGHEVTAYRHIFTLATAVKETMNDSGYARQPQQVRDSFDRLKNRLQNNVAIKRIIFEGSIYLYNEEEKCVFDAGPVHRQNVFSQIGTNENWNAYLLYQVTSKLLEENNNIVCVILLFNTVGNRYLDGGPHHRSPNTDTTNQYIHWSPILCSLSPDSDLVFFECRANHEFLTAETHHTRRHRSTNGLANNPKMKFKILDDLGGLDRNSFFYETPPPAPPRSPVMTRHRAEHGEVTPPVPICQPRDYYHTP